MSENSFKISGQVLLGTLAARKPFSRIRLSIMLLRQWYFMAASSSALRYRNVDRLVRWSCWFWAFPRPPWIYLLRPGLFVQNRVKPAWDLEILNKVDKWPWNDQWTPNNKCRSEILPEFYNLLHLPTAQWNSTLTNFTTVVFLSASRAVWISTASLLSMVRRCDDGGRWMSF